MTKQTINSEKAPEALLFDAVFNYDIETFEILLHDNSFKYGDIQNTITWLDKRFETNKRKYEKFKKALKIFGVLKPVVAVKSEKIEETGEIEINISHCDKVDNFLDANTTYKCTCSNNPHRAKGSCKAYVRTDVCEEGICKYCGYYAVKTHNTYQGREFRSGKNALAEEVNIRENGVRGGVEILSGWSEIQRF